MRPTSLAIRGLKCWGDKTLELGQLTAIQGPNGSGKTAIIQAIRLALLGYDPETGKKLDQTRKLIAPDAAKETAEIGLSFDNGFGIRRRFGASAKTEVLPPRGESTGAACQQRIDKETGGLVVSLDIATFFDLSAEKRREWLFEHLPNDGTVLEWKTYAKWIDDEGALGDVVQNLWEHNVQTAPNAVVGLGSAIEAARREFLEADRSRQAQGQVVERGEELLRADAAPEPVDEAELKDLEERLASMNQRIGEARAGREARETIENRIQDAHQKASRAGDEIEHVAHVRTDLAEQLEALASPDTTDRTEELASLEAEIEEREEAHERLRARAAAASGAAAALEEQKRRVDQYGPCPYALLGCTQDTDEMSSHVLEGISTELVDAKAFLEEERALEAKALEGLSSASARLADVRLEVRQAADLYDKHKELGQAITAKDTFLKELAERADIHIEAQTVADAELEALGSDAELGNLYGEREEAIQARASLLLRLELIVRHSERLAAHEREAAVLEERTTRAVLLKELDGNLRRLRGHVIQEMIEPLEKEADEILGVMDPAKRFRFIFERGNASTLELSFEEDGVERLFGAASKGERAMITVAFLGALLAIINPPMRLLVIDDVEKLDVDRRRRLMEGIAKLRDRFDAVIIAGACELGGVPEWGVVDLDPNAIESLGEILVKGVQGRSRLS